VKKTFSSNRCCYRRFGLVLAFAFSDKKSVHRADEAEESSLWLLFPFL